MKKIVFAVALVLIGSLVASAQVSADVTGRANSPQASTFSKHTLKATYISTGRIDTNVPGDFTAIDAANTVTCPGTSGKCLIQADMWIQAMGSQNDNLAGLCLYVDGVSQGCPGVDNIPNGSIANLSNSLGATVNFGNHTVQTVFYTLYGSFVGGYTFTYRVYKP